MTWSDKEEKVTLSSFLQRDDRSAFLRLVLGQLRRVLDTLLQRILI